MLNSNCLTSLFNVPIKEEITLTLISITAPITAAIIPVVPASKKPKTVNTAAITPPVISKYVCCCDNESDNDDKSLTVVFKSALTWYLILNKFETFNLLTM